MGLLILIILIFAGWTAIDPKSAINFKIKMAAKMGAKISVTQKTYKYARYIGIALVIVCIVLLIG